MTDKTKPEDDTVPGFPGEKWRCTKCGCLWRKYFANGEQRFERWDGNQNTCVECETGDDFLNIIERVDESPGLTQDADGTISIGPKASKFSKDKAAREADENAQRVIQGINEETEKEGNEGYIEGDESSPGTLPEFKDAEGVSPEPRPGMSATRNGQ